MSGSRLRSVQWQFRSLFGRGTLVGMSQGQLLERFVTYQDEAAFEALVSQHGPMVLGVCRRMLDDPRDVEDAFQATFLILVRKAGSLRDRDLLANWLYGVVHRVAVRARATTYRRRRRERPGGEEVAMTRESHEDRAEMKALLDDELARLPHRLRAAIVLCDLEGLPQVEAARRLGCPVGTVKSRLARGRERLRQRLARRGFAPPPMSPIAALGPETTPAAVPIPLRDLTVGAARQSVAGQAGAASVTTLVEGVLRAMLKVKVGWVALTSLVLGVVATGAVGLGGQERREGQTEGKETAGTTQRDVTRTRINGMVVDEQGRPVGGATVRPLRPGTTAVEATTDRDGTFSLELDTPTVGFQTVVASADGGARQGSHRFTNEFYFQDPPRIRIMLKPARTVTVRVTDVRGAAVPDATVEVFSTEATSLTVGQADTGGVATLRLPADAKIRHVVVLKPGVGFDYFENYRSREDREVSTLPRDLGLVLDSARTVRVTATDSAGRPVPGAEFVPWTIRKVGKIDDVNLSGSKIAKERCDARGVATFDWIPARLEEGLAFLLRSKAYHDANSPFFDPAVGQAELTTRLLRDTRIGGTARLPDGSPAAGVLIQVEGRGQTNHYFRGLTRTDADGAYAIDVYPDQTYIVAVVDDAWAAPSHIRVLVEEGLPRLGLDFRLRRGTLIHGRVISGPDKKPEPGGTVTLRQHSHGVTGEAGGSVPELVRWTTTDANGCYHLRVGPGEYRIWGPPESKQQSFTVGSEESLEKDILVTQAARATLAGIIRADGVEGRTIEGAIVRGEPLNSGHGGFDLVAGVDGRFAIERYRDPMILYARDPEGTYSGLVSVAAQDDRVTIIARPAARVSGRVVGRDRKPRPKVRIQCSIVKGSVKVSVPSGEVPPQILNTFVRTDEQGRFTISGLVVGAGAFVLASNDPSHDQTVSESFDVPGKEEIVLPDLVLDASPSQPTPAEPPTRIRPGSER